KISDSHCRGPHGIDSSADSVIYGRLERAIAVAQEHANSGAPVCRNEIQFAVSVEIAHGHGIRPSTNCVIRARAKRAIAVAEENGDIAGSNIDYGQVSFTIAVEVPNQNCLAVVGVGECNRGSWSLDESWRDRR